MIDWPDGTTLEDRLRGPGVTPVESLAVARALAQALAELHERGVAHGEVTPRAVIWKGGRLQLAAGAAGEAGPGDDLRALGLLVEELLGDRASPSQRALARRMLGPSPPSARDAVAALDAATPASRELSTLPSSASDGVISPAAGEVIYGAPRTYVLDREIGRGGMGRVVAARDYVLERTVAVKELLHPPLAGRFMREAILTARLDHPSIAPVHDVGKLEDGRPFYTMKLVSGRSLSDAIARAGSLGARLELLPNVLAVAEAIAYAHAKGIIHRDLKPSNVVIGEYGETVVVDWGAAKDLRIDDDSAQSGPRAGGGDETVAGDVVGTPAYMAPEQAAGGADERADVYGLGALLYKLLSGVHPYSSGAESEQRSTTEMVRTVLAGPPIPLEDRAPGGFPPELVAIVHKAMARDPAARYPSARELAEDLRRFTTGQLVAAHHYASWDLVRRWIRRNRGAVVSAGVAFVALVVVAAVSLHRILQASAQNRRLLRDAYVEQGRLRVVQGDRLSALAPLRTAYRMGATDSATRFLLEQAARPGRARLLTLAGHSDKIFDIAYSPDGRWLATGSADRTVRVWDAETGAPRATVAHLWRAWTVAFSPDSRYLASASTNEPVRVWDVEADRLVAALPLVADVAKVGFGSDPSVLMVAGTRGIQLWHIPDGRLIRELPLVSPGPRTQGAMCAGGGCVVGWRGNTVVMWDTRTFAERLRHVSSEYVSDVAVASDGSLLAVGSSTGQLELLRGDGSVIATRNEDRGNALRVALSPDGGAVATAAGQVARILSAAGEPVAILTGHRSHVWRVAFTRAGDRLVTAGADGTARLWSRSGTALGEMAGHGDVVPAFALRSDGARLATVSFDGTAIVWDLDRAEELRPVVDDYQGLPVNLDRPFTAELAVFEPAGDRLAVARAGGRLTVLDARSGAQACTGPPAAPIERLVWTAEHEVAVKRRDASVVELVEPRGCATVATLAHPAPIDAMSSEPGARIVTAAGNVVRAWRRDRLEATFSGYEGEVYAVGIDGDDVYATTAGPSLVNVDRLGGAAARRVYRGDTTATFIRVIFDREQGRILAPSTTQTVYVWDTATGEVVRTLRGSVPYWALVPSPDGSKLVGVGGVSPVIWDRRSLALVGQLEGPQGLMRDGAFLDDRLFISVTLNRTAIIWDLESRRPLQRLDDVNAMVVSADRRTVAVVGSSSVCLWSPGFPEPDLTRP